MFISVNPDETQGTIKYEYMPLDIPLTPRQTDEWIFSTIQSMQNPGNPIKYAYQKTIYWYLDIYSCVLVRRNRRWFESAVPIIENAWQTIEKERVEGHQHRAPKTRQKAPAKGLVLEIVKLE